MRKNFKTNTADVLIAARLSKDVYDLNGGSEAQNWGWFDDYHGHLETVFGQDNAWQSLPYLWENEGAAGRNKTPLDQIMPGGLLAHATVTVAGAAEALMAVGMVDGQKTLVYAARGTDAYDREFGLVPAAGSGQSWRAEGQAAHYDLHRPWIDDMIDYANNDANGIEKIIFTGHSVGGAVADMFMAFDAQRLDDDIDMTAVTFGSPGLHPDLFRLIAYRPQDVDPNFVTIDGLDVRLWGGDD